MVLAVPLKGWSPKLEVPDVCERESCQHVRISIHIPTRLSTYVNEICLPPGLLASRPESFYERFAGGPVHRIGSIDHD